MPDSSLFSWDMGDYTIKKENTTMEKVLVNVYESYGKGDGETLYMQEVIENTYVGRETVFEKYLSDCDVYEPVTNFVNGKKDTIYGSCSGDWDDPTGYSIEITTLKKALDKLKETYVRDSDALLALFAEEEEANE